MQTAPQGSGHRLYASYFHESSWGIWSDKSLCLEIVRNETCAVSTGKRGLESIKCMKKKVPGKWNRKVLATWTRQDRAPVWEIHPWERSSSVPLKVRMLTLIGCWASYGKCMDTNRRLSILQAIHNLIQRWPEMETRKPERSLVPWDFFIPYQ